MDAQHALVLRPASAEDRAFCEDLSRSNMAAYRSARDEPWDPARYAASWAEFENLVIESGTRPVGLLRFLPEGRALGLRDLQVLPQLRGHGIGTWALKQAQAIAVARGHERLQLRVYAGNPAQALYARLGFVEDRCVDGIVHMSWLCQETK